MDALLPWLNDPGITTVAEMTSGALVLGIMLGAIAVRFLQRRRP